MRTLLAFAPLLALGCVYDQPTLRSDTTRADYDARVACVGLTDLNRACVDASWELHTLVAKSTACSVDSDCRLLATEDPLAPPWIAVTASAETATLNSIARVRTACGEVDQWGAQPQTRCRNHRCVLSAKYPWPCHCKVEH